jgi:vacuolar protein sorting-associated protein 13A/C
MLGNPVGLFNKIGIAFVELRREPAEGMRQGPGGFIKGLGKGLAGLVKGVVGGTFDSVGSFSGSLYAVIKDSAWMDDTRHDKADNIGMGLVYGVKGIGVELYYGVGGVFSKPYQGSKREGFKGFSKGLGQGLVGLVATPVTATLRAGESISQGISGSATALANLGRTKMELMDPKKVRVRPPRRIDIRNQIKIYDEDMAIVNYLVKKINKGFFEAQQVRFYAVLPNIDAYGNLIPIQKSLLLITNEYLILMQVFNFVDLLDEGNLSKSLLLSERLKNIIHYKITKFETATLTGDQYILYMKFRKPLKTMKVSHAHHDRIYDHLCDSECDESHEEEEEEEMEEMQELQAKAKDDDLDEITESYLFSDSSDGFRRSVLTRRSKASKASKTSKPSAR